MKSKIDIIANLILFLSSLLLLIDIAPSDFSPLHINRITAIENLRKYQNIARHIPRTNFKTQQQNILVDDKTFETLKDLIVANSTAAKNINWDSVIGIKYDIISVPNASFAIRTLYVVIMPLKDVDIAAAIPIGELQDLDKWLYARHQGSLTFSALFLLFLGFLLQLVSSIIHSKKNKKKQKKENTETNPKQQHTPTLNSMGNNKHSKQPNENP